MGGFCERFPVMHPGDGANDSEAESMILVAVTTRHVYAEKAIEEMGQARGRNRFASIDHRELELALSFQCDTNHD